MNRMATIGAVMAQGPILSKEMTLGAGAKALWGSSTGMLARQAVGTPMLRGAAVGAGVGLATNSYQNMRSGRGFFSGSFGATMGGAVQGGMIGAGYGLGSTMAMGRSNTAWRAFQKSNSSLFSLRKVSL